VWVGGSRKSYARFPASIQHDLGYDLYLVQVGESPPHEKPLSRGTLRGLGVRELGVDDGDGTYRLVYTVKLRAAVYVLHAFQKKSKHGIATPQHEIDLIRARFGRAVELDEASSPL
jgi:phage-related protein